MRERKKPSISILSPQSEIKGFGTFFKIKDKGLDLYGTGINNLDVTLGDI